MMRDSILIFHQMISKPEDMKGYFIRVAALDGVETQGYKQSSNEVISYLQLL
jgi:hypothetical protein